MTILFIANKKELEYAEQALVSYEMQSGCVKNSAFIFLFSCFDVIHDELQSNKFNHKSMSIRPKFSCHMDDDAFALKRVLGAGYFGVVVQAYSQKNKEEVAIKFLDELGPDPKRETKIRRDRYESIKDLKQNLKTLEYTTESKDILGMIVMMKNLRYDFAGPEFERPRYSIQELESDEDETFKERPVELSLTIIEGIEYEMTWASIRAARKRLPSASDWQLE